MGRFICDDIFGAQEFSIELDVEFNATNSIKAIVGINIPRDLSVYYLKERIAATNAINIMDTSTSLTGKKRVILYRGQGVPSAEVTLRLVSLIELNSNIIDNCAYLTFAGGNWDAPTLQSLGLNQNDTFMIIGPDINMEYKVDIAEYNEIVNIDGSRPSDSESRSPDTAPLRALITNYNKDNNYILVSKNHKLGFHGSLPLRTWGNELIINNRIFTKEEINVGDTISIKRNSDPLWGNYLVTYFSPDEGNNMTVIQLRNYDNSAPAVFPNLGIAEEFIITVIKKEYNIKKVENIPFSYSQQLSMASIYSPREGIFNPVDGLEYPGLLPSEIQFGKVAYTKLYSTYGILPGQTFMLTGTKYRGPYIYEFYGDEGTMYIDQEFIRSINGSDIIGHVFGEEDLSDPTSTSHEKLVSVIKNGNPNATYNLVFTEGSILTTHDGETGVSYGNQVTIYGLINDNIKAGDILQFIHPVDGIIKSRISSYGYWAGMGNFYLEGLNGEDVALTTIHAADISLCPMITHTIISCSFIVEENL